MPGLNDDTLGDKVFRFALGALIGGGTAFVVFGSDYAGEMPGLKRVVLIAATVCGSLAVAFGNSFLEWVFSPRWWW